MARLRLFLAWLLLVALPLQGFAAATVLQCGPAQRAIAALAAQEPTAHEAHGHHGGHHGDAAGAGAHTGHDSHAAHQDQEDFGSVDTGHGCYACAAACHGVGLTGGSRGIDLPPAPQVHADTPFQGFESRPPPVPDKPPRA